MTLCQPALSRQQGFKTNFLVKIEKFEAREVYNRDSGNLEFRFSNLQSDNL